ncbi:hypothetical protein K402DRAFT_415220 [Aulographum hederae CBS 113979]|uniref:Uncharacterized protein n=1 Tax=Aulographum hederae CBS 113979 TaxID=1176131 RepID=A0A6G1GM12_9PEZI|nr:hypothetical protein K402DRAFT_415220 [Aulographum hederae CBS 113979]
MGSSSPGSPKDKSVNFHSSPVTSVSRPVSTEEHWAIWYFEDHAARCDQCRNPYIVHKTGRRLCDVGHGLAQDVAAYLYRKDGETYSVYKDSHKIVRVEIPVDFHQAFGLLKAIERGLRHRAPFVTSMDRTYHIAPRLPQQPQASQASPKQQQQQQQSQSKHRHQHHPVQIQQGQPSARTTDAPMEWPQSSSARRTTIIEPTANAHHHNKRGSLYEADITEQRKRELQEKKLPYNVEIREPSRKNRRHSSYWA